ncbi:MAG TPA: hypothetical protein VFF26_13655 [Gallionella sp.]|nr:hypothetical protein [Gallionella sp.]
MKIAINIATRELLQILLSEYASSHYSWPLCMRKVTNCRGNDAAATLLNQLQEQQVERIYIDGYERTLLIQLLAWEIQIKQRVNLLSCANGLFELIQPQGLPLGADVGDILESVEDGTEYEIVHFDGVLCYDDYCIGTATTEVIVCGTKSNQWTEPEFQHFNIQQLKWPSKISAQQAIWGQPPHKAAA